MKRTISKACGLMCALATWLGQAAAGDYTLTPIAVNNDTLRILDEYAAPAINDSGRVAFYGEAYDSNSGHWLRTLFSGDGAELTVIWQQPPPPPFDCPHLELGPLDINSAGVVPYIIRGACDCLPSYALFAPDVVISGCCENPCVGNGGCEGIGGPSCINDSGDVVFWYRGGCIDDPYILMLAETGVNPRPVWTSSEDWNLKGPLGINNDGTIVFSAWHEYTNALFLLRPPYEAAQPILITGQNGVETFYNDGVALNNLDVCLIPAIINGEQGLYEVSQCFEFEKVVGWDGFSWGVNGPSYNDLGQFAYVIIPPTGVEGIFVGPNPQEDVAVLVGTEVLDSWIALPAWPYTSALRMGTRGLNNNGQIAFEARLADDRYCILRADPCEGAGCPCPGLAWSDEFSPPGVSSNGSVGDGQVYAMAVFDEDDAGPEPPALFAGGAFTWAGGEPAMNGGIGGIARWDDQRWSPVFFGTDGIVRAMVVFDEDGPNGPADPALIVAGSFYQAGIEAANSVARWNGEEWQPLGDGLNGTAYALAVYDEDGDGPNPPRLYAGGPFWDGSIYHHVARWDGSSWSLVGRLDFEWGGDGDIWGMCVYDPPGAAPPELVVGGQFERANGVPASNVAKWDGSTWSALDLGLGWGAPVKGLTTWDPDGDGGTMPQLVAVGSFSQLGDGSEARRIATWDGSAWSPLRDGNGQVTGLNGPGWSVFSFDEDGAGPSPCSLFVGGQFSLAGDVETHNIARWDGSNWHSLEGGVGIGPDGSGGTPIVYAFTSFDEDGSGAGEPALYVGGCFAVAGSTAVSSVGRWDGASWANLGDEGICGGVNAFTKFDPDGYGPGPERLYAAGGFQAAGGAAARHIAAWDGESWSVLPGGGIDGDVRCLAVFDADRSGEAPPVLIAGGYFGQAGEAYVSNIAQWDGATWSPLEGGDLDGSVEALASVDCDAEHAVLIATGAFYLAGNLTVNGIAQWDGTSWAGLGDGLGAPTVGLTLCPFDEDGDGHAELFVGGHFSTPGMNIGRLVWDGCSPTWSTVGDGRPNKVDDLAIFENALYAATAGAPPNEDCSVWKWAGGTWSAVGSTPGIQKLVVFENHLWGWSASGASLVKWSGSEWLPLDSGLRGGANPGTVGALFPWRGALYVGGLFSTANETISWNVAKLSPGCPLGDMNCDGVVDFDDISPFVLALSNPAGYENAYPDCYILNGDCDCDGDVDFDDINAFVACLQSGGCVCP